MKRSWMIVMALAIPYGIGFVVCGCRIAGQFTPSAVAPTPERLTYIDLINRFTDLRNR